MSFRLSCPEPPPNGRRKPADFIQRTSGRTQGHEDTDTGTFHLPACPARTFRSDRLILAREVLLTDPAVARAPRSVERAVAWIVHHGKSRPCLDRRGHAHDPRLRADRTPAHRPRPCHRLRRPPPPRPTPQEQRPPGTRRDRPARGRRPAVRETGGHRALCPELRPLHLRPLRMPGPPGDHTCPGEGRTERRQNR